MKKIIVLAVLACAASVSARFDPNKAGLYMGGGYYMPKTAPKPVPVMDKTRKCPRCFGTGKIREHTATLAMSGARVKCPECEGRGHPIAKTLEEECRFSQAEAKRIAKYTNAAPKPAAQAVKEVVFVDVKPVYEKTADGGYLVKTRNGYVTVYDLSRWRWDSKKRIWARKT